MAHRKIILNGQPVYVDIVGPVVENVRTKWGLLPAKPGDVKIPDGRYVVLVPGQLLDKMQALPVEAAPTELDEFSCQPEANDGEAEEPEKKGLLDYEGLGINELKALAARAYPREKPWFTMRKEAILAELASRESSLSRTPS